MTALSGHEPQIKISIPAAASRLLGALRRAGFEAYVVGGCVRDSLLGRTPGDWDICTSARPEQVRTVFSAYRQILTGEKHGTVAVIVGGTPYEITTYRVDGQYHDSRHPDAVQFVPQLQPDLARRDFTINAMAYAPGEGLIDLYGGRSDLHACLMRCVGNPEERFAEDALRILRAVRLAAQLDFALEKATERAALDMRQSIQNISAERIYTELDKLLAAPAADTDWEWVKPGLVSWDWWNGMRLSGVDFRAGRNTESYRYYIDFAAKYGVPYIIMDEGWSASTTDVFRPNPDLDLPGLIAYGKERNVQIVLWLTWLAVEKDMERLFTTLEEWGIPGVKIDFMDRSDQWMVNYYERVTKCAADHHIFVDWHGSYTPKGLFRTYPNLLTYEAVLGMEQGGRCKPDNSNYLPFIRNAVGPMDFTPGGMFCSQPEDNRSTGSNPMASGTRAYQLALYVVFESPLQMMADNPVYYYREHPCTEFIASVPTTWDELRVLRARCGEQVVMARRKGDRWFIGGITNNQPYSTEVALDFLPAGRSYTMTSFEDGVNADLQAMDYKKRERKVDASTVVKIDMVRNGGWAAVIE